MKSFIPELERDAILDLVLRRVTDEEFLARTSRGRREVPAWVSNTLARAVKDRDSLAAELALCVGHRFGFELDAEPSLTLLASASWHERHEDVVDALVKLRSTTTVGVLAELACADFPYREYDDAASLKMKAVRGIANLGTPEARQCLEGLSCSRHGVTAEAAREWIRRLSGTPTSEGKGS